MLSNKSQTRNNFSFCFCFGQAGQTASVAVENCLSHTKKSISFVLFVKKKKKKKNLFIYFRRDICQIQKLSRHSSKVKILHPKSPTQKINNNQISSFGIK